MSEEKMKFFWKELHVGLSKAHRSKRKRGSSHKLVVERAQVKATEEHREATIPVSPILVALMLASLSEIIEEIPKVEMEVANQLVQEVSVLV